MVKPNNVTNGIYKKYRIMKYEIIDLYNENIFGIFENKTLIVSCGFLIS